MGTLSLREVISDAIHLDAEGDLVTADRVMLALREHLDVVATDLFPVDDERRSTGYWMARANQSSVKVSGLMDQVNVLTAALATERQRTREVGEALTASLESRAEAELAQARASDLNARADALEAKVDGLVGLVEAHSADVARMAGYERELRALCAAGRLFLDARRSSEVINSRLALGRALDAAEAAVPR